MALKDIDVKTGKTRINWDLVFKAPGEKKTICYWNTRSYWPTAYHPGTNSLYTSYIDNCREVTSAAPGQRGGWRVVPRPGSDPKALTGLAKINLSMAVMTGDNPKVPELLGTVPELELPRGHNEIYVFALP